MASTTATSTAITSPPVAKAGTLSALKSSSFRLYFVGQLVSVSGTWMQTVAQQVVVYNLTNSEFALGITACAQGLPALLLTPFAGVIIDRFSRRKILVAMESLMMMLAFIMAALEFSHTLQFWHILLLSLGLGVANALDGPARQAIVVEMVGKESLGSGIVLNSIMMNAARIIGPAIGGFALVTVGASWCFLLNGISFIAVIAGLLLMHINSVKRITGKVEIFKPLLEGLRFVRTHPTIRPLLILSAITSVFGLTFATIMAPLAQTVMGDLQVGPTGLLIPHGLTLIRNVNRVDVGTSALLTAHGIGAVLAAVFATRTTNSGKRGRYLFEFSMLVPIALVMMSVSPNLYFTMVFAGLAGFALISEFILVNTMLQSEVLEEFRGRVLSLYVLTFFGLSPFGSLLIGFVAEVFTVRIAIWLYGAITATAIILLLGKRANPLNELA